MSAYAWPGIEFAAYRTGNGCTIARAAETHEPPTCGKCGAENCSLIAERTAPLTTREREIIRGVVQALSNKDIAVKFSISEQTVKNHLHNIFEKLAIYSRLELALYAIHQGQGGGKGMHR